MLYEKRLNIISNQGNKCKLKLQMMYRCTSIRISTVFFMEQYQVEQLELSFIASGHATENSLAVLLYKFFNCIKLRKFYTLFCVIYKI